HHLALELVEPLRTFLPVVVGARIRAADHHDDEVAVVDALVAHRRPEQVAVLVDPLLEIQRRGDHGGLLVSGLRGRPGSGPGPGRTVRPVPVRCPRPGPGRARGRRAGYRPSRRRAASARPTRRRARWWSRTRWRPARARSVRTGGRGAARVRRSRPAARCAGWPRP